MSRKSLLTAFFVLLGACSLRAADPVLGYAPASHVVIVADGVRKKIEVLDAATLRTLWSAEGLSNPRKVVVSEREDRAAVLDPLEDVVLEISLIEHRVERRPVAATPLDALFAGETLFVLCRDGRTLESFGRDGTHRRVRVGADAVFLAPRGNDVLVYSRSEGRVELVDTQSMQVIRSAVFAPFASDFEVDKSHGYLVYPRGGQVVVFDLERLSEVAKSSVGAVPVDLDLAGNRNALSAGAFAVADPSSKRIWMGERNQSEAAAFTRGFMRGLLGLGLYKPSSVEFPTGVDRIWVSGDATVAYDSSSERLLLIRGGKKAVLVRSGVAAHAWLLTPRGFIVWNRERGRVELLSVKR